ncbi:MAG: ATP-binding protein [Anaerolineae bacterium]|nr:ATP-binding protein [Anaerolineae bacterium]MDW8172473.1 ATP-binding protein [Anaerolineae bacterium]
MDIVIVGSLTIACAALAYALYHVRMSQLPLSQRLDEQARLIVQLQHAISEHLSKRAELNDELAKCDALILNLRRSLAEADATIGDLQQKLAAKDSFIANLRGQIATSERGAIESKAFFQALSSVAYDLVFVLNEDRLIIALNKAAEAIFGQRNPIGEKLRDVLQSDELEDIISRALGESESLEEQIILQNRHYRVRTQVMRYSNYRNLFIGVALQDITQLVRLNRARRDMVANISHELRTPIANIRLIIEGLFHDQNRPKRKASIASLRSIARETDSLLALLQELFDLSMIESGQAIMKLLPTNLLEIVNDAVHRLSDQLEAKHLRVVNHVPLRLGVLCDYEQTRRVLANLIHNAIKWSPVRGDITISADLDGEDVVVSIFDNGPGVPDDQRERIFERFYQVDTSRSPGTGGTGLGLAICKHIVEKHGGRIWAEGNSKGNGGRFFFTLLSAGDVEVISEMTHGQHDHYPLPFQQSAVERQFEGLGDDVMVELEDDGLNP